MQILSKIFKSDLVINSTYLANLNNKNMYNFNTESKPKIISFQYKNIIHVD